MSSKSSRKCLTLEDRVKVINLAKSGHSGRQIAEFLGVGKTQIQSILKRKAEILDDYEHNAPPDRKRAKRATGWEFFKDCRSRNAPVNGPLLQAKALKFAIINQTAALSQIREQQQVTSHPDDGDLDPVTSQIAANIEKPLVRDPPQAIQVSQASLPKPQLTVLSRNSNVDLGILNDSVSILQDKLKWASQELQKTLSVEYSKQLCELIKSCADAMKSCQQTASP